MLPSWTTELQVPGRSTLAVALLLACAHTATTQTGTFRGNAPFYRAIAILEPPSWLGPGSLRSDTLEG
jgi:hypothetical protein